MESLYGLTSEQIKRLTMKEFYIRSKNIMAVGKMYNPFLGGEEEGGSGKRNLLGKQLETGDIGRMVSSVRKSDAKKNNT